MTKLIATGPVGARREDRAAAAAEESEKALLQEIAETEAADTSLGQIEVAPSTCCWTRRTSTWPPPGLSRPGSRLPPRSPRPPTNTFGSSEPLTARAASRCAWRAPPARSTPS
ncbi:hypothetical protein [Streptomyces sp. NPDC002426]